MPLLAVPLRPHCSAPGEQGESIYVAMVRLVVHPRPLPELSRLLWTIL